MIEDDRINGRDGSDILEGNASSDVLLGGSGNDIIYHWTKEGFEGVSTHSDIFDNILVKDTIICGSGQNKVFINTSMDNDVPSDCEIVDEG